MLDIKFIIENKELVKHSIKERNLSIELESIIQMYEDLKRLRIEMDSKRAESNQIAKKNSFQSTHDSEDLDKNRGIELKKELALLKDQEEKIAEQYKDAILLIPNILPKDTPTGKNDEENLVLKTFLTPTKFSFKPKDHLELAAELDLLDFEAGAKVSGGKFYFLKNEAVMLEAALKQYAMRVAAKHGYTMLQTPDLTKSKFLQGIGFSPRGSESNTYHVAEHDLVLVATAEVAVAGLHADEIIDLDKLPLKYVAESHCFRTEAGAAGKADKGLYRVHQFSKIELFQITTPDMSEAALEEILAIEEEIYKGLELPYRVVRICAGDLGAPAYKKYDIEAWMPGKNGGQYGEVTSASNCTAFQARRLNIKFKDKDKKNQFAHTLNGTAVALSRTPIAILENYQNEDGSVTIPTVLRPFMGIEKISRKRL